jgi:hypothetical protein
MTAEEAVRRTKYVLENDMTPRELVILYCEIVKDSDTWTRAEFELCDGLRIVIHKLMCDSLGLDKGKSRSVTDHLDEYNFDPEQVYNAIRGIQHHPIRTSDKAKTTRRAGINDPQPLTK